ncbi:hypothetical protein HPP92_022220 [Vanilla planifolia]|uniref:Uncharacterized protein n=1 Tax=Vanilla planifolia TaxID=51239 RepID=A0A835PX12_VANPL|nr:hypothetical protein HPP92_022531 [Vanilla planifolia]KAG0459092.1 hypothetical protein HPP92_022220 [Vanilla planifolia]
MRGAGGGGGTEVGFGGRRRFSERSAGGGWNSALPYGIPAEADKTWLECLQQLCSSSRSRSGSITSFVAVNICVLERFVFRFPIPNLATMASAQSSGDDLHRREEGPLPSASKVFAILLLTASFLLARRMREKVRSSAPLLVLAHDEIAAAVCILVSSAFHLPRFIRRLRGLHNIDG